MRRFALAACLAATLAGGWRIVQDVILPPPPDPCADDAVCESWFWRWYYNCDSSCKTSGGGGSGAS